MKVSLLREESENSKQSQMIVLGIILVLVSIIVYKFLIKSNDGNNGENDEG